MQSLNVTTISPQRYSNGTAVVKSDKELLLQHLVEQHKSYRDEIRIYLGFAAASITLLVILLFSVLTVALGKDATPRPKLYVLIPLGLIWYGAILALFMIHVSVLQKYSELIEWKINSLLDGKSVFEFDSYNFPTNQRLDLIIMVILLLSLGGIPLALSLMAGYKGLVQGFSYSTFGAGVITAFCALAIVVEASLVIWARISRRTMNEPLKSKWLADLQSHDKAQVLDTDRPEPTLPAMSA